MGSQPEPASGASWKSQWAWCQSSVVFHCLHAAAKHLPSSGELREVEFPSACHLAQVSIPGDRFDNTPQLGRIFELLPLKHAREESSIRSRLNQPLSPTSGVNASRTTIVLMPNSSESEAATSRSPGRHTPSTMAGRIRSARRRRLTKQCTFRDLSLSLGIHLKLYSRFLL
jgi:hypothetical protein